MSDSPIKRKPARPAIKGEAPSAPLSIADIKELFTLMRENDIAELEFDQADSRVHIVSKGAHNVAPPQLVSVMAPVAPVQPHLVGSVADSLVAQPQSEPVAITAKAAPEAPSNHKTVYSPMVGTFYRAASPENPPFVQEGDVVNEESVLCIIEAMKLMNEIKAETKGKIVRVLVENGMPVEYNQPLFLLEP